MSSFKQRALLVSESETFIRKDKQADTRLLMLAKYMYFMLAFYIFTQFAPTLIMLNGFEILVFGQFRLTFEFLA